MSIKIPRQQEIIEEAMQVLWQHLPPSKVSLVISMWFAEGGDYLKMREELFEGETVESLAAKIQPFQERKAD
ncbi:hypothetical protein C7B76_08110 [filamentous cyanobacterium CCP2]|nr:hypothetical protein C7B76_08110 [filamentous cyanobacterium CCP2]